MPTRGYRGRGRKAAVLGRPTFELMKKWRAVHLPITLAFRGARPHPHFQHLPILAMESKTNKPAHRSRQSVVILVALAVSHSHPMIVPGKVTGCPRRDCQGLFCLPHAVPRQQPDQVHHLSQGGGDWSVTTKGRPSPGEEERCLSPEADRRTTVCACQRPKGAGRPIGQFSPRCCSRDCRNNATAVIAGRGRPAPEDRGQLRAMPYAAGLAARPPLSTSKYFPLRPAP